MRETFSVGPRPSSLFSLPLPSPSSPSLPLFPLPHPPPPLHNTPHHTHLHTGCQPRRGGQSKSAPDLPHLILPPPFPLPPLSPFPQPLPPLDPHNAPSLSELQPSLSPTYWRSAKTWRASQVSPKPPSSLPPLSSPTHFPHLPQAPSHNLIPPSHPLTYILAISHNAQGSPCQPQASLTSSSHPPIPTSPEPLPTTSFPLAIPLTYILAVSQDARGSPNQPQTSLPSSPPTPLSPPPLSPFPQPHPPQPSLLPTYWRSARTRGAVQVGPRPPSPKRVTSSQISVSWCEIGSRSGFGSL